MRKITVEPGLYYSFGLKNMNSSPEHFFYTTFIGDNHTVYKSKGVLYPRKSNNTTYCLLAKKIHTRKIKNTERYLNNVKIVDPFTVTYKGKEVFKITSPEEIAIITTALLKY